MKKKEYIAPETLTIKVQLPQIMAGSGKTPATEGVNIIDEGTPEVTTSGGIGAKSGFWSSWDDEE